ncbi:MAG TPA: LapA family protein [Coleofasciculaceae cyanobacterium]
MPVIRIVLLMSVVGGLTLFAFSNLSPVLPLVFLGMTTAALPLATWIGFAIAAGAITSFFLQSLSYLQRGSSPRRLEQPDYVPPQTRSSYRRETPQTPEPEPQTRYTPPPPSPEKPTSSAASDWEEGPDEDWDFEEEPAAPRAKQPDLERDSQRQGYATDPSTTPQAERTSYEVKQEPKTGSQTGSVYSYSYRESQESGVGKADAVYDADYRLIRPPYQSPPEPEEDDDWGFEDDDEFDDQDENPPKRR